MGPYLIESKDDRQLLGGTGLALETRTLASTGYVLARDAWGRRHATQALAQIVTLVRELGLPNCTPYAIQTIQPQSVFWKNAVLSGGCIASACGVSELEPQVIG